MLSPRPLVLALMVGLSAPLSLPIVLSPAQAAETAAFSQAAFDAAQKTGAPILVEVTAPWCPVCKVQKPILSDLAGRPRFAKLKIFTVDFDTEKSVLKTLGVQKQSTLISYKGGKEVGRSTGTTDKAAIETQLNGSI